MAGLCMSWNDHLVAHLPSRLSSSACGECFQEVAGLSCHMHFQTPETTSIKLWSQNRTFKMKQSDESRQEARCTLICQTLIICLKPPSLMFTFLQTKLRILTHLCNYEGLKESGINHHNSSRGIQDRGWTCCDSCLKLNFTIK